MSAISEMTLIMLYPWPRFWIGRTDWRYVCRFDLTQENLSQENLELVCEGLDTIAMLELNGQQIGTAPTCMLPIDTI